jgi:hypothetical protein
MSVSLTSYPRTSGGGGSGLVRFQGLLDALVSATALDMEMAARDLLATLRSLSGALSDADMVALAVKARDAMAVAKGRGRVSGTYFRDAMLVCARHWMALHPDVMATGLGGRAQAAVASRLATASSVALRAADVEAGSVAWLYQVSALLGEDVTATVAHAPIPIAGTRYRACAGGGVLDYLECAAGGSANQFLRIRLPDPAAPPLVIAGQAKSGASGYGTVQGPRALMLAHGLRSTAISQRDMLYPLSRAAHLAAANPADPAGSARREAGRAIIDARRDGVFMYLAVRSDIDMANRTVSGQWEEFTC